VDVGLLARRVALTVAPGAAFEAVGLPVVRALPREFEQLLANLIGNAAKFVEPGVRPEIRLTCAREEACWRFELADNGIGVDPRFADRVFGMFQRLHGADAYPGTGIGLAIAAKIVEGGGGRIWVARGQERGSVFAFTWPD
jgi:signal transduction histidine kinase